MGSEHPDSGENIQLILKVTRNSISDKRVPPLSLQKYLIFHTRHYMSRGQVYLRHLISEPQKVSNGCKWANISFSCFLWNEYILIVRFARECWNCKTAQICGTKPSSLFFFTTEISCSTSWRVLSHVPAGVPSGSVVQPAHLYVTCWGTCQVSGQQRRKKRKKQQPGLGLRMRAGVALWTWGRQPSRWWGSPRCRPQVHWAGKKERCAPRIWHV